MRLKNKKMITSKTKIAPGNLKVQRRTKMGGRE